MTKVMNLTKKANKGDRAAVAELIKMFETGDGVEQNFDTADFWAARLNDLDEKKSGKPMGRKMSSLTIILLLGVLSLIAFIGISIYRFYPAVVAYHALEQGDFATALELFNEDIDGKKLAEDYFRSKAFSYLKDIESQYKSGKLLDDEMKAEMKELVKFGIDSVSSKSQKYIDDIDGMEKAVNLLSALDYEGAIDALNSIDVESIKYREAQGLLMSATKELEDSILGKVGNPENFDACIEAVDVIKEGLETIPNSNSLISKKAEVEVSANGYLTSAVKECLAAFDFDGANALIKKAEDAIGGSDTISELKKELNEKKPVSIGSLKMIDSYNGKSLNGDRKIDSFGNDYSGDEALYFNAFIDQEAFIAYDGGFSVVCGTFSVGDKTETGSKISFSVRDEKGNILYSKENMNRLTGPVEFKCDISAARRVILVMTTSGGFSNKELLMKDVYFYR